MRPPLYFAPKGAWVDLDGLGAINISLLTERGSPRKPRDVEPVQVIDDFFHLVIDVHEAPAKLRAYRELLTPELRAVSGKKVSIETGSVSTENAMKTLIKNGHIITLPPCVR